MARPKGESLSSKIEALIAAETQAKAITDVNIDYATVLNSMKVAYKIVKAQAKAAGAITTKKRGPRKAKNEQTQNSASEVQPQ